MSSVTLPRSGILAFMDDDARRQFATYGTQVSAKPGQVLIREGEVNRTLYIVLSGTFNITTEASGTQVHLDTVGTGDCLGEVAIFNPDRASATATSLQEGRLWSIEAEALQEFLLDWPSSGCAAILGINIMLSRRLKRANTVIRSSEIVPSFLSVRAQKRIAGQKLG
jgi:CRP/FNR family transcriptional regulator, cyclic AMP receptor protein